MGSNSSLLLGKLHAFSELLFSHLESVATSILPSGIATRNRIWKLLTQSLVPGRLLKTGTDVTVCFGEKYSHRVPGALLP